MNQPIGIVIIGTGVIAHHHAKAIRATAGARLVGVYARDRARCLAFAEQYQTRAASTLEELFSDPAVSVVIIATPSGAHAEHAIAAARAGKHVLCEKPLDITLDKTDRILTACADAGVILCPVFQNRFGDPVRAIKQAIDGGRLGRLLLGRATVKWKRTQEYYRSGNWRGTKALDGGGCLINQSIHTIDLLIHLMGEPSEVFGYIDTLTHQGIEVEDTACAVLRFKSGALGVIEASTSCDPELPVSVTVSGSGGTVGLQGEHLNLWEIPLAQPQDAAIRAAMAGAVDPSDELARFPKHCRQLEDLLHAIRTGGKPTVSPLEGRLALEVVIGIYQSAATKRPYQFAASASRGSTG